MRRVDVSVSWAASRGTARGLGSCAWIDQQNRAIRLAQVLLGSLLNRGRSDLAEIRLERVDARRVVIEQRKRCEQISAPEARELGQYVVHTRAHFSQAAREKGLVYGLGLHPVYHAVRS